LIDVRRQIASSMGGNMTTPTASGPEGTPLGPKEGLEELDPTTKKTSKIAESHFSKVKDETVHILSVLEQYNFSTQSKTAFRDLSKYLSGPGDSIGLNQFHELSNTARKQLSDEIERLGRKSLDDFKPVGSDFNSVKFIDSVDEWGKSVGSLRGALGALIESELSALPNAELLFQRINPREAKQIEISRKAQGEERAVSEKELSAISEVSNSYEEPEISDECIRMGTTCKISLSDSQFNPSDYTLELETAFASKLRDIFGNPEGHHPQGKSASLRLSIADRIMTTLSRLDQIPEMKENETVHSFSFPTLIIRPKKADSSLMSFSTVHNRYPGEWMSRAGDSLGDTCEGCKNGTHADDSTRPYECFNIQAQYDDIKRQGADVHAVIVGKCDVVQRVVHRGGDLVFEKGIRGNALTELMRVPVAKLQKKI
jgi:hypothetical protein